MTIEFELPFDRKTFGKGTNHLSVSVDHIISVCWLEMEEWAEGVGDRTFEHHDFYIQTPTQIWACFIEDKERHIQTFKHIKAVCNGIKAPLGVIKLDRLIERRPGLHMTVP